MLDRREREKVQVWHDAGAFYAFEKVVCFALMLIVSWSLMREEGKRVAGGSGRRDVFEGADCG